MIGLREARRSTHMLVSGISSTINEFGLSGMLLSMSKSCTTVTTSGPFSLRPDAVRSIPGSTADSSPASDL